MGNKMLNEIVDIKVTEITKNGNGIGEFKGNHHEKYQCEVPFSLPGDFVKVKITSLMNGTFKGHIQKVIVPSPLRVSPRCSHFGSCGGCSLQHIPYKGQLLHKEKIIRQLFENQLSETTKLYPIIGCKSIWNYRSKMDLTFSVDSSGKHKLGLIQNGTKGCVVNLNECHISPQWFMDAQICIKQWWEESKIRAYDPITNQGVLRYLTLREGRRSGDRMVILTIVNNNENELSVHKIEKFVARVNNSLKPHQQDNHLSIVLRIQQCSVGLPTHQYDMLLSGNGILREGIKVSQNDESDSTTLYFDVDACSFFQPNPQQAEAFYSRALQMAQVDSDKVVYDLFCGIGTFGICISKYVKQVVSIDILSESIVSAQNNAKHNQCTNILYFSGAVRHVLAQLKQQKIQGPDAVFVNPPRPGLDPQSMAYLIELNPKKIVYASFNPVTQAQDIQAFLKNGYSLVEIQPFDFFPHTKNVECISLLIQD